MGTSVWEHLQPLDTFGNGDELFPELQPSYGFGTEFAMLFDEAEHPRGQGGQFAKKEAHEMTRAEHGQEQESLKITTAALNKKSNALEKAKMEEWMNLEEDDRFGPVGTAIKEKYQSQIEAITDQAAPLWKRQKELAHPKNTVLDLANTHRRHVEVALAAGKHVPPEVLADYPDLDPGDKFQPDAYDKKTDSLEAYNDKTLSPASKFNPSKAQADLADISPGSDDYAGGWFVRHETPGTYAIFTDKGVVRGGPEKIMEFLAREWQDQEPDRARIDKALTRVTDWEEPAWHSQQAADDARAFAGLPGGIRVVSLNPSTYGRLGAVRKEKTETGKIETRIKFDNQPGLSMSGDVEPLDERYSWRTGEREPEAARATQQTFFATHAPAGEPALEMATEALADDDAEAILDRALGGMYRMNERIRQEILDVFDFDDGRQLERIREILERYKPIYAASLTETELASVLAGMKRVVSDLPAGQEGPFPSLPTDADAVAPPAPFPPDVPPEPPEIITRETIPGEPAPEVHFPIIDNAVKDLAERRLILKEDYVALENEARAKAFTVAGVETEATLERIRDTLAENVAQGVDYREWKEKVEEAIGEGNFLSEGHTENVFRTNVMTGFSNGMDKVLDHPLVKDAFPYWEYYAIHDDRARPEHLAMEHHGIQGSAIYRNDDPIAKLFTPPWSWQCFLPGTLVQGRFTLGLKTWYSGQIVEIMTCDGNRLAVTANHPILTPNGFVTAKNFSKGDDLLCYGNRVKSELAKLKHPGAVVAATLPSRSKNDGPTKIEDVFGALSDFGGVTFFPLAAQDLHGDAQFTNRKVEVVGAYGKLGGHKEANIPDSIRDLFFASSHMQAKHFASCGLSDLGRHASFSSLIGFAHSANQFPELSRRFLSHSRPFQSLHVGEASHLDASLYQTLSDDRVTTIPLQAQFQQSLPREVAFGQFVNIGNCNPANRRRLEWDASGFPSQIDTGPAQGGSTTMLTDAEFAAQLYDGFPNFITVDKIIKIRQYDFRGHVYDLQSDGGWMVANSIVTSNCRCSRNPLSVASAARRGIREAIEWLETGEPPANPEYVPMPPFRPDPNWTRGT